MENKKDLTLAERIANGEDIKLSDIEYENAIKKEEYFRNLYTNIFDFSSTKDFKELCSMLLNGYDCLMSAYKDKKEAQGDISYIIKFAFRDFYLLIFINMKNIFDNSELLKDLHKKVYSSNNYVELEDFEKLVNFCREEISKDESK
ncbi:MAG: hypothetical protein ACRC4L_00955 [Mycoplasma sp.]